MVDVAIREVSEWSETVRQIAVGDKVIGGEVGPINISFRQLASRTVYLKNELGKVNDGFDAYKTEVNNIVNQSVKLSENQTITGIKTFINGLVIGKDTDIGIINLDNNKLILNYHNHGELTISKDNALRFGNNEVLNRSHIIDSLNNTAQNAPLSAAKGKELNDKLNEISVSGMVVFFASPNAPSGWLKCNGAAISRTVYANLFAAIGTTFGSGDGRNTFNLPDLRGEFLRGLDDGRGVDSNRRMGSNQSDAIRNITGSIDAGSNPNHQIFDWASFGGAFRNETGYRSWSHDAQSGGDVATRAIYFDASRVVPTANENRPRNVALLACIKI